MTEGHVSKPIVAQHRGGTDDFFDENKNKTKFRFSKQNRLVLNVQHVSSEKIDS